MFNKRIKGVVLYTTYIKKRKTHTHSSFKNYSLRRNEQNLAKMENQEKKKKYIKHLIETKLSKTQNVRRKEVKFEKR